HWQEPGFRHSASTDARKRAYGSIRATKRDSHLRRVGPAIGLRLVDPERVELGELMQEARLRRDAHGQLCGCNQDGLAELPVPRAIAELAPLEGGEIELGRFQVCD